MMDAGRCPYTFLVFGGTRQYVGSGIQKPLDKASRAQAAAQSDRMPCACFVMVTSKTPLLKVQVKVDASTGSGISRIFQ